MRAWQVERRKRTRQLIELGGLVIKAGIVELTADDRATIYGALLWTADKLQSAEGEHARDLWAGKGKEAFDSERHEEHATGAAVASNIAAPSGKHTKGDNLTGTLLAEHDRASRLIEKPKLKAQEEVVEVATAFRAELEDVGPRNNV